MVSTDRPRTAAQERSRTILLAILIPVVLLISLGGVDLVQTYNVLCWNGADVDHYANGQIESETTYRGGLRHGHQTRFYPNGQMMSECTYERGKLQGPHRSWDNQGRLLEEIQYAQGKIHGTWTQYDETGRAISKDTFDRGIKVKSLYYIHDADGTRTLEGHYRNGRPQSGDIVRYVSGQGYKVYTYDQGKLVGSR